MTVDSAARVASRSSRWRPSRRSAARPNSRATRTMSRGWVPASGVSRGGREPVFTLGCTSRPGWPAAPPPAGVAGALRTLGTEARGRRRAGGRTGAGGRQAGGMRRGQGRGRASVPAIDPAARAVMASRPAGEERLLHRGRSRAGLRAGSRDRGARRPARRPRPAELVGGPEAPEGADGEHARGRGGFHVDARVAEEGAGAGSTPSSAAMARAEAGSGLSGTPGTAPRTMSKRWPARSSSVITVVKIWDLLERTAVLTPRRASSARSSGRRRRGGCWRASRPGIRGGSP